MNVSANVGHFSLSLVNKHFPLDHMFSKIFNRNNMKVSYSCILNLKSRINIYDKTVTNPQLSTQARACNYIKKIQLPLKQLVSDDGELVYNIDDGELQK